MRAWVNGRLLDSPGEPAISAVDHGFVVGDGIFETALVIEGRPFALTRHLERLTRSAIGLGLAEPDLGAVRAGIEAVLDGQPDPFARLRITVSSGPGPMGSPRGDGPQTVAVLAEPIDAPTGSTAVVTVPWPRNERGALAGIKSTSYAENALMVEHARARGATESLLPNTRGEVCEGTGSNVFYEHRGRLATPTLDSGCLAGVTRALVLAWCAADIEIVEEDGPMERLADSAEMFVTSSTRNVMGVHALDGRTLPAPGPLTRLVSQIFERRMREEIDP